MRAICFFILLMGILGACSDFLEPKSQNEYVPETAVALNEMLLGSAYPKASGGRDLMSVLPMLDDDLACSDTLGGVIASNSQRDFEAIRALFSWQPDFWVTMKQEMVMMSYKNYWEEYYQCILGTNAALDYVDDVKGTFEEIAIVKAQAYALRAFYYFQLVNLFGEPYNYNKKALGVPLKITSAMENKDLARNTVEEVYTQIVHDLTEAEKLYEALPENKQFQKDYRTSLPMV
ncbi:MAG: RagB/SusD family nutrient uptake outer membrane protein, partial [Bacteroidales bacterium]|nr:RagB/SusD family nutrient uptake outer membrane protein [Bacteroidales bacterium]